MHAGLTPDVGTILAAARAAGRSVLLEPEGLALARLLGLAVPHHAVVAGPRDAATLDLSAFDGDRLVVKVCSPDIAHKSAAGGVAVVAAERGALVGAIEALEVRFAGHEVAGFLIGAFVPHDVSFGGELLLGMRWTDDFGPVVTLGPGGAHAELLAGALDEERGTAILSPSLATPDVLGSALAPLAVTAARGESDALRALLERALDFAERHVPSDLLEFELNPVAFTADGLFALDAFGRLGAPPPDPAPPRPLHKLARLLAPRSMAIVGVSERRNPGRIILENVLAMGFPAERVTVIKPGTTSLAGCRCVPDVASLPEPVDLAVVAVDAARVPEVVEQAAVGERAETIILIPGGLGERPGTEERAQRVRATLDAARRTAGGGPLVNGGNCLGVRSIPGHYDTLFIPRHKLRFGTEGRTPLALLAQSGAFAVARTSVLWALDPRLLVTVGNQIDLTMGDWLTHLKDDPTLEVFACYVEGFAPRDGRRWLQAAAEITASGRQVVLYRAGRSAEGADATASHTASVAGDHVVTRRLAQSAGVLVADSLGDFDDLVRLSCLLRGRRPAGRRLGAVSNAGFECVAMADNVGPFQLAALALETQAELRELLERHRLGSIVGVRNPLDLTPILGDEGFARAAAVVLADPSVDVGIVGCVPHTGALQTLPPGEDHDEDLTRDASVAQRLVALFHATSKPLVVVVDAGPVYDALARHLEEQGVPVFRRVDRALRLLARWWEAVREG